MRGRDAGKDAHLQLLRGELSELNRLVFGFDMELRAGSTGVRPKICPTGRKEGPHRADEEMSTEVR